MQQVDAATRVQSVVRRRLDKHKIDDLIQQKRVEEIIAEKEREELEQREQMDQNAERQSIFDMILTPFGTGSGSGDGDEMDGHAIRRAKEKRVAFVDLKKTDIPPDGKFWGSGYFVYWSDKHNRPYFYNPEMDETQWFPPDENREDDDDVSTSNWICYLIRAGGSIMHILKNRNSTKVFSLPHQTERKFRSTPSATKKRI
jgi:hypothetical protein